MEILFEPILKDDKKAFEWIAKWDNAEDIKYFIRPNFNEGDIELVNAEELYENFKESDHKYIYFITVNHEKVGYVSLDCQFPMLVGEKQWSGWLSICVGESYVRHLGLGTLAMTFIENYSRELGLKRLELGVFDYNHHAIAFYHKMGYTKIRSIENFVYYQGCYHSDNRMEKWL